jgi:hypothetical protein
VRGSGCTDTRLVSLDTMLWCAVGSVLQTFATLGWKELTFLIELKAEWNPRRLDMAQMKDIAVLARNRTPVMRLISP